MLRFILAFLCPALVAFGLHALLTGDGESSSPAGQLQVADALARSALTGTRWKASPDAGVVEFRTGLEGEIAVLSAWFVPPRSGRPDLSRSVDLSALQTEAGDLHLTPWLERNPGLASGHLLYSVLTQSPAGPVHQLGILPLDPAQLGAGGIIVIPELDESRKLSVETLDGTPIPGAHLGITRRPFELGPGALSIVTDENGQAVVRGLNHEVEWMGHVLEGVGPFRGALGAQIRDAGEETRLVVPLGGAWKFTPVRFDLLTPGQAVLIESLEREGERAPRIWPVARVLPPGRPLGRVEYLMSPRAAKVEVGGLSIRVRGLAPVAIEGDVDRGLRAKLGWNYVTLAARQEAQESTSRSGAELSGRQSAKAR